MTSNKKTQDQSKPRGQELEPDTNNNKRKKGNNK